MRIFTRPTASPWLRWRGTATRGLLAFPVLIVSCHPACDPVAPPAPRVVEERQIGTSVEGRPIVAYRVGTQGGTPVLAVGSIHGDEQAGIEIVEYVRDVAAIPEGLDVWVIPTINPDGNVRSSETNAAGVDLNRNFSPNWQLIDCATEPQNCSGPEPMSEPESRAVAEFVVAIQPRVTVWYHAVGSVVDNAVLNGVANPDVLTAYASEVGYRVATVPCGRAITCTGNATQFQNFTVPGSSAFVVELSTRLAGGMSPEGVTNHVNAFWAAAAIGSPAAA